MPKTIIKKLKNGGEIVFDKGRFDDWCVYIVECNGNKTAPRDSLYFSILQKKASNYPENKIYHDFVRIYEQTNHELKEQVLTLIDEIVDTYRDDDKNLLEQWFTVLYAGMIAEERKAGAVLKKRIKRLGMYQVLILDMNPDEVANFSKGKRVSELDPLMKQYGF